MKHVPNTVRARRFIVALTVLIPVLLLLDTLGWKIATSRMAACADAALAALSAEGWVAAAGPPVRGGWPFGAWIEWRAPSLTRADMGWRGERARFGGSWPALMLHGPELTLPGRQAARLLVQGGAATLLAEDARFGGAAGKIRFSARTLEAGTTAPVEGSVRLTDVAGRALVPSVAGAGSTRLGVTLKAATLEIPPLAAPSLAAPSLAAGPNRLRDAKLAFALTAGPEPAPLLSPQAYNGLLLQDLSASLGPAPGDARLILSGRVTLPALDGRLTLTLLNWRDAARRALNTPALAVPAVREALESRPAPGTPDQAATGGADQPLTLEIPLLEGEPAPQVQQVIRALMTPGTGGQN